MSPQEGEFMVMISVNVKHCAVVAVNSDVCCWIGVFHPMSDQS